MASTVWAWDDAGHKITAYIAWQRMTPATRDRVIEILRTAPEDSDLATFYQPYGVVSDEIRRQDYFMTVATWADIVRDFGAEPRFRNEVRNRKYHKGTWHYADTFWRQTDGKVVVLDGFKEGGLAVEKLVEFDRVIRDPSAGDEQKAIAIAWIMHIGGDIHQPLHTSARVTETEPKGDQGGNLFLLSPPATPRNQQVNLHWFWDSITGRNILPKDVTCERDYIEPIARRIMKKFPFAAVQNDLKLRQYQAWQVESFAYNNTHVFSQDLSRNRMPPREYTRRAFRLAERQFAMAGYRLGETMNAVFGPAPNPNRVANAHRRPSVK